MRILPLNQVFYTDVVAGTQEDFAPALMERDNDYAAKESVRERLF